jgi:hypothetical protein
LPLLCLNITKMPRNIRIGLTVKESQDNFEV